MPVDYRWITAPELIDQNSSIVAVTNEPHAVINHGLLEGAIAAPVNLNLYEDEHDLLVLGVRLLDALAQAHAFQQGNKRTAFFGFAQFIELNGGVVALPDTESTAISVLSLVNHKMTRAELVTIWRPFMVLPKP